MLTAIAAIELFHKDTPDFASYCSDLKTRSAIERQLQILTEAAYRIGKDAEANYPGTSWSGWVGVGNILRHGYHRLDNRTLWEMVTEELPMLQVDVTAALHKLDQPK